MSELKFKRYTLWVKWKNLGWRKLVTCVAGKYPMENPRKVLENYVTNRFPWTGRLDRGRTWMILPGNRKPVQ